MLHIDINCGMVLMGDAVGAEKNIELVWGPELFALSIVSLAWLEESFRYDPFLLARPRLIVKAFEPDNIRSYLADAVSKCEGKDWLAVAGQISRFAQWELSPWLDGEPQMERFLDGEGIFAGMKKAPWRKKSD